MNRLDIHKQVIEHYGAENQLKKFAEELEELKDEILDFLNGLDNKKKVINEYADVLNCIEQFDILAKHFKLFEHIDIDKEQNRKMQRTLERIK